MKKRNIFTHKTTLILLAIVCFFGREIQAQGPNAPEAASFEPVDATDMVNLVTGNLSYVLPLLNVPSPEGGYPIALSYHAGIAMEQEASWVGLGWSLNPGSINRGVNGYPDDWGKTNYSEFFYDKGWTDNYYSLSLGVQVTDAVSVGLGLSWGSNQSLGGFVSASIGLGEGGSEGSIGFRAGTNGISINGGNKVFSASLGTSGVGIGYSKSGAGINLNWSPSSGISGGVSASGGTGSKGRALNGKSYNKTASLGINFSSKSTSINGSANGLGAGITNYTNSDGGEYDVNTSSISFNIPIYMFYIGWSHTKVNRSLFKHDNLYTSGMLYPVESNKSQSGQVVAFSNKMEENHFMDVNVMHPFSNTSTREDLIYEAKKNDRNNLILPNYDNYNVSAQGLSGTLTPYTYKELILSARGSGEQNNDNDYVTYLNKSHDFYTSIVGVTGNTPNEIDKKYFTFSNAYNSYLKLNRGNFSNQNSNSSNSENLLSKYITSDINSNGFINGKRKREGNYIVTYTNKEIRQGNLNGFIEARENFFGLNRNNKKVFLDEGVGAYQITTMDGKTYHYSLPVYQFESFHKNYPSHKPNGDKNNSENDNFFEIQKTTPYATHWLLTAITGPDYYDKNNNDRVDEGDYGYWVEFYYGKWTDGYIWETPREEFVNENDATKKTTAYTWGRKQMYYLDAIKTRTHTALFIKDIRKDYKSISKNYPGREISSIFYNQKSYPNVGEPGITYGTGFKTSFKKTYNYDREVLKFYNKDGRTGTVSESFTAYKSLVRMSKTPINFTLALKKIILLKSQNYPFNESSIDLTNKEEGFIKNNICYNYDENYSCFAFCNQPDSKRIYTNDHQLDLFYIHQHKNILDIKDIEGLNLESQAIQVIDFEHDYSLADKAPNAETGRLTLKSVNFKGKEGVSYVPPYQFEYDNPYVDYKDDKIDDWGYYENYPQVWSLDKITTPTGGEIKIDYDKDAFFHEAASYEVREFDDIGIGPNEDYTGVIITFNENILTSNFFEKGRKVFLSFTINPGLDGNYDDKGDFKTSFLVDSTINNKLYLKFVPETIWFNDEFREHKFDVWLYLYSGLKLKSNKDFSNLFPVTVKYGGGIVTNSITISDGLKDIATTEYVYKKGITSYAPSKEPKGIPYVSELPAPMVLYGEVEMNTKDGNGTHLGSTVYEFETLEPRKNEDGYIFSLGDCFKVKENQNETLEQGKVFVNKYTIESRIGNIGRMKSISSYNSEDQLLSKSINNYKTNLNAEGEIGVTQESFKSYKSYRKDNKETFYINSTSKINYPSVLESVSTTQGNFSVTEYFDKYDFLTGQVLETRTFASDGVAFKTKVVPAYTNYAEMGSKVDNESYANMLTQQAANITYIYKNNDWKPIGANITTWNNNWDYFNEIEGTHKSVDIWRKHKEYVWNGNIDEQGLYMNFNKETDDNFQWGVSNQAADSKWRELSEITHYDHYSMALEVKDINNNYVSTKMADNQSKVLVTSNARYREMFYTGLENLGSYSAVYPSQGDVGFTGFLNGEDVASHNITDTKAHTGNHSLLVDSSVNSFEVSLKEREHRTGKYKISIWVDKGNESKVRVSVNSALKPMNGERTYAGDWVLLNHYEDIDANTSYDIGIKSASGSFYADDFRLHPIASSMTSYVYNEFDELTYIIGANGLATCFVYDAAGRLDETYVEVQDLVENPTEDTDKGGFKRVSKNTYNYKN